MYQIISGNNENIFRNPKKTKYGSSTWIKQIVDECADLKVSLKIPQTLQLHPPRENDGFLMKILEENITNTISLEQMNICRIYLKVIFISDI